jgi:16S rRNA (uracil1498-N3)-methyltransferase
MARVYRFFTRHLTKDSLPAAAERPFHLYENLEPEIFYQLTKVLRVKSGDEIVLLPMQQEPPYLEYSYGVESADKKEVVLRFIRRTENANEPSASLTLMLCLPNKPDKLEFILQKAVELGASRIILLEGDFSQMKHNLRNDRLEKIMTEAAEQCERALIPQLLIAGKLKNYLKGLTHQELKNIYVAMERDLPGQEREAAMTLFQGLSSAADISILIGPEGGFSDEEKTIITDSGIKCFSLGSRILRMETAAILSLGFALLHEIK